MQAGHWGWSEDFESFTAGGLPAGPLSIGSGQAEIFTDGPQQVYLQTGTGNQAYWNVEPPGNPTSLGPQTIIRGLGSSSLSVSALSFNYNMGGCRSCETIYVASFLSSGGIANAFLAHTSVSYPNGENGQDVPSFLGWLGAQGELLQQVTLTPRATGIVVDDIRTFAAVPAPATLPLVATGLGLMGLLRWRKRSGRIKVGGR